MLEIARLELANGHDVRRQMKVFLGNPEDVRLGEPLGDGVAIENLKRHALRLCFVDELQTLGHRQVGLTEINDLAHVALVEQRADVLSDLCFDRFFAGYRQISACARRSSAPRSCFPAVPEARGAC
jgi:hypothetical protein